MYFGDCIIRADEAIVDRFKGGFVQTFNRQCLSVSIPYSSIIARSKRIKVDFGRIAFVFSDGAESALPWKRPLRKMNLHWFFDFSKYVHMTSAEKQHAILDALHLACSSAADELRWPKDPLNDAYQKLKESNCEFSGLSKTKWISPDGKHRVSLWYSFQLEGIALSTILFRVRRNEEVERVPIGTFPHCVEWVHTYMKRGHWKGDFDFEL
jgi:hypothetical protein